MCRYLMRLLILVLCAQIVVTARPLYAGNGQVLRPPFSISQQYIVLLDRKQKVDAVEVANEMARTHGGRVGYVWNDAIDGFTIRVPDAAAVAIAHDPRVLSVEQNSEIFLSSAQNTSIPPAGVHPGAGSLWALDRIDQQNLPLDGQFTYCDSGFGVKIYVVDMGVLKAHQEFYVSATDYTTRVLNGATFTTVNGDGVTPTDRTPAPGDLADYGTNPCNALVSSTQATGGGSHGTSVASLAAGLTTGTAKSASIVPVKVITCGVTGFVSDAIAGLNWVLQQHLADPTVPKVVNMSMYYWLPGTTPGTCATALTTSQVTAFETAVQNLVTNGITVVVAANNHNQDARNVTPSRLAYGNTGIAGPHVISVGGTMLSNGVDTRWLMADSTLSCTNLTAGSNWGVAVDLFAPADDITAAAITLPYNSSLSWGYRRVEHKRYGTSFASPYVAAVVARFLQTNHGATPADAWQYLQNFATYDVIDPSTLNGSPNRLLRKIGAAVCKVRS